MGCSRPHRICGDSVTTSRTITIRPQQKPWLNAQVTDVATLKAARRGNKESKAICSKEVWSGGVVCCGMVWRQQPCSQHPEVHGDDCGFHGGLPPNTLYINRAATELDSSVKSLQYPQDSPSAPLSLEEDEEGKTEHWCPQGIPPWWAAECPDVLPHCVVRRLHGDREEGSVAVGKICTEDHRVQLTTHRGHLYPPTGHCSAL